MLGKLFIKVAAKYRGINVDSLSHNLNLQKNTTNFVCKILILMVFVI